MLVIHELYLSFEARLAPVLHTIDGLIMMDISMAKRSIMYDTNESYDSSKVVEVSRAVRWHCQSETLKYVKVRPRSDLFIILTTVVGALWYG